MWQLDNKTSFAAERAWVRDRNGAEVWLVAVKATFHVRDDGGLEVAADQPPVLRVAEYHGESGASSLKYDADLVLTKKTTDIIVVGHVYAPQGTAITQTNVGFKVGPVQKMLRVFGDRAWRALGASAPQPFEKMPLVYERAYGGIDPHAQRPQEGREWRNPVGAGFVTSSQHAAGLALPNIENPRDLVASWRDRPEPAGFGAIDSHWQPRVTWAGTYDDRWMKTRQPLLAEDLDDRYFQCAPADQQAPRFLRGGEPVVLLGLTPKGRLEFSIPRLYLGFETRFFGGGREIHDNRRLHTIILEPDFPRVSLVWHSALPCHFRVHKLQRTVVTLKTDLSTREAQAEDDALEAAAHG
jgi:hypothetical protein